MGRSMVNSMMTTTSPNQRASLLRFRASAKSNERYRGATPVKVHDLVKD